MAATRFGAQMVCGVIWKRTDKMDNNGCLRTSTGETIMGNITLEQWDALSSDEKIKLLNADIPDSKKLTQEARKEIDRANWLENIPIVDAEPFEYYTMEDLTACIVNPDQDKAYVFKKDSTAAMIICPTLDLLWNSTCKTVVECINDCFPALLDNGYWFRQGGSMQDVEKHSKQGGSAEEPIKPSPPTYEEFEKIKIEVCPDKQKEEETTITKTIKRNSGSIVLTIRFEGEE